MDTMLILIGYVPLTAALVYLVVRLYRHSRALKQEPEAAAGSGKEYPRMERAIPNADRILADDGPSLKDSDMEELKTRISASWCIITGCGRPCGSMRSIRT